MYLRGHHEHRLEANAFLSDVVLRIVSRLCAGPNLTDSFDIFTSEPVLIAIHHYCAWRDGKFEEGIVLAS